jgi:hypothetical protein
VAGANPRCVAFSSKQVRGRNKILFAEQQIEIEEVSTLTPL